jgi:para-nitrobenzyl esterase
MTFQETLMDPIVTTASGQVRGESGNGVFAFRGIPYAAAPIGKHRFRPPAPPERWDGVRDAVTFGLAPPQSDFPLWVATIAASTVPKGEDCLNLNVWTPELGKDAALPVLVWIHGGGFLMGSGADSVYDGSAFARDGVVTVTLNYRLDALGFLCVGDEGAGAFGILDQIAALAWVQENIAAFGGDPGKVTIAGESAGAWSVSSLLAAPKARGLFRRACSMSGAAHHHVPLDRAAWRAEQICQGLGVRRNDLEALQALPTDRILQASMNAMSGDPFAADPEHHGPDPIRSWLNSAPVVGGDVLPERAIDAVAGGSAAGVDLLVGHTLDEGRLFLLQEPTRAFVDGFGDDAMVSYAFAGSFGANAEAALARYGANRPGATRFDLVSALLSDLHFRLPAIRLADAQSRYGKVYFYRFSWPSPLGDGAVGSTHAIELPFMFDTRESPMSQLINGPSAPADLAHDMHKAWVSFIKAGDPSHASLPSWPRHDASRPVMDFGVERRLLISPAADEAALWDDVAFLQVP